MRVVFPMSVSTVPRVESVQIYVAFDCLFDRVGMDYAEERGQSGCRVIQFGGTHVIAGSEVFAWGMPDFEACMALRPSVRGVVVYPDDLAGDDWSQAYDLAACDSRVAMIAISCGATESSRVQFIMRLVRSGKFCTAKPHWLYGFHNPAELSVYRTRFLPFIYSKIDVAVCSSCFIYSAYGVEFSESVGVVEPIPDVCGHRSSDLGMAPWLHYNLRREQLRGFQDNMALVQAFAHGTVVASEYVESLMEGVHG